MKLTTIKENIINLENQIALHLSLSNKNKVAILRMKLKRFETMSNLLSK
jgi:hypothetical protein